MNPFMLYLSGPMSHFPDHNNEAFQDYAKRLRYAGYGVVNPADFPRDLDSWEEYVKRDLRHLLDCQGVAVLDGWQESRGAVLEVDLAHQLKLPVLTVDRWIEFASAYV